MLMAALAAMGGVTSTYVNMIGDFFQSFLGFAGTTQWAAGLHVLWIMLSAAILRKTGAASMTGVLKGFVELFSGNTHGLLVVIIDIAAGVIVDLVLLTSGKKQPGFIFYLAAGLASASNVIIFQFFAAVPEDILTFIVIAASSTFAFISGVVFGGFLSKGLVANLQKIGMIETFLYTEPDKKKILPAVIIIAALIVAGISAMVFVNNQSNSSGVMICGAVANPYSFPDDWSGISKIRIEATNNEGAREYEGFSMAEIIDYAEPLAQSGNIQITASDGYQFFVTLHEVFSNKNLILFEQNNGKTLAYNVAGAESQKAWVRGVNELKVIPPSSLKVWHAADESFTFLPEEWQSSMDSTFITLKDSREKLQGVPLIEIWRAASPTMETESISVQSGNQAVIYSVDELAGNRDIRIFIHLTDSGMEFILGKMDGEILLGNINRIEIQ